MMGLPALVFALLLGAVPAKESGDVLPAGRCEQAGSCSALGKASRGNALLQSSRVLGKRATRELEGEEDEDPDADEAEKLFAQSLARGRAAASELQAAASSASSALFPCPAGCSWCSPYADASEVVKRRDVKYGQAVNWATGQHEDLFMDVYEVPSSATKPVMVIVHGGSFKLTSSKNSTWAPLVAELLARHGFLAVSVEYRRYGEHCKTTGASCRKETPNPKLEAPVHDVLAAVRYMRKNAAALKADPDRIALFGCSAGGATVAQSMIHDWGEGSSGSAGYSSNVRAGVVLSGTSRGTHLRRTSGVAPYLAFHSVNDGLAPYGDAIVTRDYLTSLGTPNELITMPGSDHCPDIFHGEGNKLQDFMGFLAKYLQLPGSACPDSRGSGPSLQSPPQTPSLLATPAQAPPTAPSAPLKGCPAKCKSPACGHFWGSQDAWVDGACTRYCTPYDRKLWCTPEDYGSSTDCTSCLASSTPSPAPLSTL